MPKLKNEPLLREFVPYTEDCPGMPSAFVEDLNRQYETLFREIFESCKAGASVNGFTKKRVPTAYVLQQLPNKPLGARLTYRSVEYKDVPTDSAYQRRMSGGVSNNINELRSDTEPTAADAKKIDIEK